jgi:hypothetical protein
MRLIGQKALILGSLITMACRDSTSPAPFAGTYFLLQANDQQLPAVIYSSPGETITVITASLTLTPDANAVLSEQRRYVTHGVTADNTFTNNLKYHVTGNDITIGSFKPCPMGADCMSDLVGKVSGSNVTLMVGMVDPSTPLIYTYQREDPFAQ